MLVTNKGTCSKLGNFIRVITLGLNFVCNGELMSISLCVFGQQTGHTHTNTRVVELHFLIH